MDFAWFIQLDFDVWRAKAAIISLGQHGTAYWGVMTAKLAKLDMMNLPEAFSEFIKAHHAKPRLARTADVVGNKKYSYFSSTRNKVCWHKPCFGHSWQPGPCCPCSVTAQHEKLKENAEKQQPEATLKHQKQLRIERAAESEHQSQLQLWGQQEAAGTRQSKR